MVGGTTLEFGLGDFASENNGGVPPGTRFVSADVGCFIDRIMQPGEEERIPRVGRHVVGPTQILYQKRGCKTPEAATAGHRCLIAMDFRSLVVCGEQINHYPARRELA